MEKAGRNDPCPCGSGKKYKQCCHSHGEAREARTHSVDKTIQSYLQAAVEHHQAGRLPQAEAGYRQILQMAPNHPDALHFLGLIAHHLGKNEIAAELISKAISANPFSPVFYSNLGNVLQAQGRLDEAVESFRKALSLKRDIAEAHYNLGNTLQAQGKLDAAIESYHQTIKLKPDFAVAHYNLGLVLQAQSKLDEAIESFQKALVIKPELVEAHNNLGLIFQSQGKTGAAVESYHRALVLKPDYAEAHYNLGAALKDQGNLDAAIQSYRKALALKPDYAEAHNNLGVTLDEQGKLDEAVESYRKALSINPDDAMAHYNLGCALQKQRKLDVALQSYRKALALNPEYVNALNSLGCLQMEAGHPDEALACFQQVIKLDTKNVMASYFIASITGVNSECASSQYMAELFDGFAHKFEASLLDNLNYDTPKNLIELIAELAKPVAKAWDVLDLGCGTGLVGSEIAPYARQLVGVDLSAAMLAIAKDKNLYQRLEKLELLAMMKNEIASSYDVIIAADVFVYIGRLDEIMKEIKRLLRPGGVVAFSVEALDALSNAEGAEDDGRDCKLNHTGRYAHSSSYINKMANAIGFMKHRLILNNLRFEGGKPVQGWLVLLENTAHKEWHPEPMLANDHEKS